MASRLRQLRIYFTVGCNGGNPQEPIVPLRLVCPGCPVPHILAFEKCDAIAQGQSQTMAMLSIISFVRHILLFSGATKGEDILSLVSALGIKGQTLDFQVEDFQVKERSAKDTGIDTRGLSQTTGGDHPAISALFI